MATRSFIKWGCLAAILSISWVSSFGCRKTADPDSPQNGTNQNARGVKGSPLIKAEPNPIPAVAEKGVTTISWDTGDGSLGYVAFSINSGPEKQWMGKRPKGSQEVNWINKGAVYEFRLYGDQERSKLLASVRVTRN